MSSLYFLITDVAPDGLTYIPEPVNEYSAPETPSPDTSSIPQEEEEAEGKTIVQEDTEEQKEGKVSVRYTYPEEKVQVVLEYVAYRYVDKHFPFQRVEVYVDGLYAGSFTKEGQTIEVRRPSNYIEFMVYYNNKIVKRDRWDYTGGKILRWSTVVFPEDLIRAGFSESDIYSLEKSLEIPEKNMYYSPKEEEEETPVIIPKEEEDGTEVEPEPDIEVEEPYEILDSWTAPPFGEVETPTPTLEEMEITYRGLYQFIISIVNFIIKYLPLILIAIIVLRLIK